MLEAHEIGEVHHFRASYLRPAIGDSRHVSDHGGDSVVPWLASMSWIVIVHFDITGAMHRNAAKPSSQRFREPAPEPQGER